ncbi:MAG: lipid II flippase MurJ [bacterium]|nr:lipid II flippase MurJ [bacterium]
MTGTETPKYAVAARRIGSVSAFVAINMALQVVAQMMIAFHFGAGQHTDAYFMARDIADLFGKFFLTGQITVVLMPLFLEYHNQRGPEESMGLMKQLINLILIGAGGALVLLGIGAPWLVRLLAPGFAVETQALTVGLFRILLLSTFLTLLVGVAAALLNAFQRFTLPRATAGLLPMGLILALWMFKPWGGVFALAWGLVVGNAVQAVILFTAARRDGLRWHLDVAPWRNEGVRRFFWLVVPFFGAYAAGWGQGAVYNIIVSYFPAGSLSALSYSGRTMKALFAVALTGFSVVIYHSLARQAVGGKMEALADTTAKSLRMILFVLLPLTAVGMALSTPIIQVLLERGSFSEGATVQTAGLFIVYLMALPLMGCSMLLNNVLYSLQQTRVAVNIGIVGMLMQAALYWPLSKLLGLSGFAWVIVCSNSFLCVACYRAVVSRVPPLRGRISLPRLGQNVVAAGLAGLVAAATFQGLGWLLGPGALGVRLLAFISATVAGLGTFGLIAYLWSSTEAEAIWGLAVARFRHEKFVPAGEPGTSSLEFPTAPDV